MLHEPNNNRLMIERTLLANLTSKKTRLFVQMFALYHAYKKCLSQTVYIKKRCKTFGPIMNRINYRHIVNHDVNLEYNVLHLIRLIFHLFFTSFAQNACKATCIEKENTILYLEVDHTRYILWIE